MIIIRVVGGIGNQMFQYALGCALSVKLTVPFKLDISCFDSHKIHNGFELDKVFNCEVDIATKKDINKILEWQSSSFIMKFTSIPFFSKLRKSSFVIEPHYHFWNGIENITDNSYLVGYWQSEKYFQDIKKIIIKDFTFKSSLKGKNIFYADLIQKQNSVSIHVRRGDYIKSAKAYKTHGVCDIEYYDKALDIILKRVNSPHFFVFSDEVEKAKYIIKSIIKKAEYPFFFIDNNNGIDSYNDMRLMSMCKHNIIANSSFSWWAGWLNSNQDKIVIAPQRYINDNVYSTKDLLPLTWVKI